MPFERPHVQGEVPEIDYDSFEAIPIKYELPFHWGTVRVSEAADIAYNLQPIDGVSLKNYSEIPLSRYEAKESPRVNVWILAAGEVVVPEDSSLLELATDNIQEADTPDIKLPFIGSRKNRKGLDVIASFPNSALTREATLQQLQQQGITAEDMHEEIGLQALDGMTTEEAMDMSISQAFIHEVVHFIENTLPLQVEDHYREKHAKRQIRGITSLGIIGTFGAGYTAATGSPGVFTGIATGAYGAIATYMQRDILRKHLLKSASVERGMAFSAEAYTARIAAELHSAYCRGYFLSGFQGSNSESTE